MGRYKGPHIVAVSVTIDDRLIAEIVRRICRVSAPDRIVLFGSAATGTMTSDSDIDLLVVEKDPGDRLAEYVRIRSALRGLDHPFDIIVMSAEWYGQTKDVIAGIAYPADHHGRVIYDAA